MEHELMSSKRSAVMSAVCFVATPIILIVTASTILMYQNSSSFDIFSLVKAQATRPPAVLVGAKSGKFTPSYNGYVLALPPSPAPSIAPSPFTAPAPAPAPSVSPPPFTAPAAPAPAPVPAPAPATTKPSRNRSFKPTMRGSTLLDDKLLNGLLSTGFDEVTCLSRYKSHQLRKPILPYRPPSRYLIHKLRSYEHLHQRCGPYSASYKHTMKKLKLLNLNPHYKLSSKGKGIMCRYLVWSPVNGLGNRMISLVSAFLYSLLTDRVFLVEFGEDMKGLFCEPFPNSTWLISPKDLDFPHWRQQQQQQQQPFLLLNLGGRGGSEQQKHSFFCDHDHSQSLISRVPILFLQSDQYMVPGLVMAETFRPEIGKMFPPEEDQADTVFHQLGRYLFHPSNEVWGFISRFYQAHLAMADERIGLQVRVFAPDRTPAKTVMDQILACTIKYHHLLPQVVAATKKKELSILKPNGTRIKAVLVASLSSYFSESLSTMYGNGITTVNGDRVVVGVYQPSYEGRQKHENNNHHNIKALADIYLLSLCDVLVTSGESTFGYVAQGLAGLKPWILRKTVGPVAWDPPCIQAISMEPCYHFPPQYDCNNKTTVNDHHIIPCEDRHSGFKLVARQRKP